MTRQQARHQKKAFLEAFRQHGNVLSACREIGIDRANVYRWKKLDPAFLAQYEQAEIEATETMELEAHRRAVEGTEKPIYQGGRLVGTVREYSDTLLIFMLKARAPEKYRERHEHTGKGGGPIEVSPTASSDLMSSVVAAAEQAALAVILGQTSGSRDT